MNSFNDIMCYNAKVQPNTYHTWGTYNVEFYKNYLLTKAMSVFEWKVPSHWSLDYFKNCLFVYGTVAVINTIRYGIIPQQCSYGGYNIFYEPNTIYINNPILGTYTLELGKQVEIIKMKRDWCGIMDIVNNYAELLAECDKSIGINLINTKTAWVFSVNNKTEAETMKKMYDEITRGNPAVFVKNGNGQHEFFTQNLKQNYIVQDLIIAKKSIMQEFNTLAGLNNANFEKRERMIKDEVNANNGETKSLASEWLEEMQSCCDKVNKMFGIDISVKFRKGVAENEDNVMGNVEQLPRNP